jgi:acyl-CoA synthetase (AMP-forming)/AMP-acid ligase II
MRMGGNQFEYYKDADKTSKSRLKDSGFWTVGDVGYFDSDGFLFLNDRSNDMIIVGGVNVYPAEIEGAPHPTPRSGRRRGVRVPNEDTGEEIKAVSSCAPASNRATPRPNRSWTTAATTSPAEASPHDRLHHRDAARSQRQALQAQAARAVLGRPHPQHP